MVLRIAHCGHSIWTASWFFSLCHLTLSRHHRFKACVLCFALCVPFTVVSLLSVHVVSWYVHFIGEEDGSGLFGRGSKKVKLPDEQRLLRKILYNYDTAARPVYNASNKVTVQFGFTLTQIADMVCKSCHTLESILLYFFLQIFLVVKLSFFF